MDHACLAALAWRTAVGPLRRATRDAMLSSGLRLYLAVAARDLALNRLEGGAYAFLHVRARRSMLRISAGQLAAKSETHGHLRCLTLLRGNLQPPHIVVAPSFARLHTLAALYRTSAAALLAERDEAMPLFALLDQASAEEIARFIRLLNDARDG